MAIVPTDLGEFHGEPSPSEDVAPLSEGMSRSRRILRIVTGFFLGQGAVQGISVLTGLFLVRMLSLEAYAQFSLAAGFQIVFTSLMDLGFASTIIPMVGEQREDRALVGRYVRSAKHWRDRAFWVLAPFAVAAFLTVMHKQHWNWSVQLLLLGSILLALYSSGRVSYYSAPLFLYGRLREYYVPQILSGAGRFASCIGLGLIGGLNAWTAAGLGALNVTVNGSLLARRSRPFLKWPEQDDPTTDREVLRFILPVAPAIIFSAFQSQITLFLISIFGGTVNVAEVAALNRIGQFFSVLMTFNMIVIEPYVARLRRERLLPIFLAFIAIATVICTPVVLIAFSWPKLFLWVLGSKYADLTNVVGWVVLSACMNYVAGLMWIMNRARKWVFWSGNILEIVLVLSVQIIYVAVIGVRTTREAVLLGFASSFCYLAAHGYVTIYGFFKDARVARPA
jgi:O-antigen/teichoic acid export membrane protein